MKKSIALGSVLLLILAAFIGCSSTGNSDGNNSNTGESLFEIVEGMERKDIHAVLGEPSGMLSGMFGDTYLLENGTNIIVYYNGNEEVENLMILDKDGNPIPQIS